MTGGEYIKTPVLVKRQRKYNVEKLTNQGTESSVSLASIQGVEHHRSTMRMPLGHRGK